MIGLFRARKQPATRFRDIYHSGRGPLVRNPPNRLFLCRKCYKQRPAKNLIVQVYYDGIYYWCARRKGCKKEK